MNCPLEPLFCKYLMSSLRAGRSETETMTVECPSIGLRVVQGHSLLLTRACIVRQLLLLTHFIPRANAVVKSGISRMQCPQEDVFDDFYAIERPSLVHCRLCTTNHHAPTTFGKTLNAPLWPSSPQPPCSV